MSSAVLHSIFRGTVYDTTLLFPAFISFLRFVTDYALHFSRYDQSLNLQAWTIHDPLAAPPTTTALTSSRPFQSEQRNRNLGLSQTNTDTSLHQFPHTCQYTNADVSAISPRPGNLIPDYVKTLHSRRHLSVCRNRTWMGSIDTQRQGLPPRTFPGCELYTWTTHGQYFADLDRIRVGWELWEGLEADEDSFGVWERAWGNLLGEKFAWPRWLSRRSFGC